MMIAHKATPTSAKSVTIISVLLVKVAIQSHASVRMEKRQQALLAQHTTPTHAKIVTLATT
jgi:hypothetical protein